jgi:hypothetical protein
MYDVLPELYREMATKIIEHVGHRGYYSGVLDFEWESVECRMVLSAVIYRRTEQFPEGERSVVADMVPVWWEFHTFVNGEEVLNNFSFNEMREYID